MSRLGVWWVIIVFLTCCDGGYTPEEGALGSLPEVIDYNFHVQPILSDKCYHCHGPDANTRKAELRLDTKEGLGNIKGSQIMTRVLSKDLEEVMPPPEAKLILTDYEKAILAKWIDQGTEWKPHWSFIPPQKSEIPEVNNNEWPQNEIDYFILSKLEQEGLTPNERADRETLIRRVSLDLTGLPPEIEAIDDFLSDQDPRAYEKLVDKLLSSPQYGEHMSVDWLDLARYADTHGYQADFYRPHWPWRDWVITAFNQNMPYDEFVTWQLAGDLLPNASKDQILATGFNRNHAQNNEGGIVEEEFRVEYVADRTQTFGTAFLGLTLQCARCHDHKYDPVSQKEFYQLFAFFNNVAESGQTTFYQPDLPGPTLLLPEPEQQEQIAYIEKLTTAKQQEIASYKAQKENEWKMPEVVPKTSSIGLIGHFDMETATNQKVSNQVGTKHGQIIDPVYSKLAKDPPQLVPGRFGLGIELTGDDAISIPGMGRFDRTDQFTIGLWIKVPSDLKSGVIFHNNKGSALYTYKGYQLSVENGQFDVRLAHNFPYNAIHLLSEVQVPTEEWVQVTLSYDGSSTAKGTKLYLNGQELPLKVVRDNLYKDIVFHPKSGSKKPPIDQHLKVGARWRGKGFTKGTVDELKVFSRELTPYEVARISEIETAKPDSGTVLDLHLATQDKQYSKLMRELKSLRNDQNNLAEELFEVMVIDEMAQPRLAYVLDRGVYDQRLEQVGPGTPQSVMSFQQAMDPNRLGLAKWLFDPQNPLPARVTVNRFWQHYFGTGMVKTTDDFGSQGERPIHPLLLDWLAVEFIDSGWDVKHLQKLIVMSATYQQSSRADSTALGRDYENRLLARGPSSRLSAEALRDLVLSASGLLVDQVGGPSVKPYQPPGLWAYNPFSSRYEQDHGDDLYRRSLYTFWKRTNPPPTMNIFDAPSRSYCVVKREKTATPLQALVLLNDPQFIEAARVLAQRIMNSDFNTSEEKINLGYRLLTGKAPRPEQLKLLEQQFEEIVAQHKRDPARRTEILTVGEFPLDNQLDKNELVAYTQLMSTVMNFDATTMKR